jgi:hypothetical protein
MHPSRRQFLETAAGGAAALTLGPNIAAGLTTPAEFRGIAQGQGFDHSWPNKVKGKHKVVMDVPEIDSGYGVWRSTIWASQYGEALKVPASDTSTVLVLRHNGIFLGMKQSFWDTYGIGKEKGALHPLTGKPTTVNPALMTSAKDGLQPAMDAFALPKFIERGGIALGCNLAFEMDVVPTVQNHDKVDVAEARKRAMDGLLPGVILQPSGIYAAIRAQEAGCVYIRAS